MVSVLLSDQVPLRSSQGLVREVSNSEKASGDLLSHFNDAADEPRSDAVEEHCRIAAGRTVRMDGE